MCWTYFGFEFDDDDNIHHKQREDYDILGDVPAAE